MLETIEPCWDDYCIVAATGPSLTEEVAEACKGHPVVAVKDAARLPRNGEDFKARMPWAPVMYCCDVWWWDRFEGLQWFKGERWSTHEPKGNEKLAMRDKYGVRLVAGKHGEGFSFDPALIHYGSNSGFQAMNLALHKLRGPRKRIIGVGFDMFTCDKRHFFGHHERRNVGVNYEHFIPQFKKAAKMLPDGVEVIIASSPKSGLREVFPSMTLEEALPRA